MAGSHSGHLTKTVVTGVSTHEGPTYYHHIHHYGSSYDGCAARVVDFEVQLTPAGTSCARLHRRVLSGDALGSTAGSSVSSSSLEGMSGSYGGMDASSDLSSSSYGATSFGTSMSAAGYSFARDGRAFNVPTCERLPFCKLII